MKDVLPTRRQSPARFTIAFQTALRKQDPRLASLKIRDLREFTGRLGRQLRLQGQHFDVTLVNDVEIAVLNRAFRGKAKATDVLSFPFIGKEDPFPESAEFSGFLGDIVISVETALRQAAANQRSLLAEVQDLILHGALHLLGYDHETDHGEMKAFERRLRKVLSEKQS
ncbi:MAG: rRNA maturation RNase YbeY [Acidobacteriota bacterium]|nr:rRNA maturation RNase YbeY [Acidobacteriota bacterium]